MSQPSVPRAACLSVAILEDEPLARRRLERLVKARPDLKLIGSFDHPLPARTHLQRVDVLFLDVEMPFENGYSFLSHLPAEWQTQIIVTTAHGHHAIAAFRHDAVDFLLKPFDEDGFAAAVARARKRLAAVRRMATLPPERVAPGIRSVSVPGAAASTIIGVRVRDEKRESVLAPADIDWIRVAGRRLIVHDASGDHEATGNLATWEARLAGHGFLRIRRDCLLNLARIASIRRRSHGDRTLILKSGEEMQLSRRFASAVEACLL
ncbi:MAG: response regulator transcription factor [Betaproteobacteria bacterium]|nr:response regulator transcription factor [Betaproteobacteria bacterium]